MPKYNKLIFEEKLLPLTNLNTEYNDFNSTGDGLEDAPSLGFYIHFLYSSYYPSKENNFYIFRGEVTWYKNYWDDEFFYSERYGLFKSDLVNSKANEFGSYYFPGGSYYYSDNNDNKKYKIYRVKIAVDNTDDFLNCFTDSNPSFPFLS